VGGLLDRLLVVVILARALLEEIVLLLYLTVLTLGRSPHDRGRELGLSPDEEDLPVAGPGPLAAPESPDGRLSAALEPEESGAALPSRAEAPLLGAELAAGPELPLALVSYSNFAEGAAVAALGAEVGAAAVLKFTISLDGMDVCGIKPALAALMAEPMDEVGANWAGAEAPGTCAANLSNSGPVFGMRLLSGLARNFLYPSAAFTLTKPPRIAATPG
jgi:hypothetical protein